MTRHKACRRPQENILSNGCVLVLILIIDIELLALVLRLLEYRQYSQHRRIGS